MKENYTYYMIYDIKLSFLHNHTFFFLIQLSSENAPSRQLMFCFFSRRGFLCVLFQLPPPAKCGRSKN